VSSLHGETVSDQDTLRTLAPGNRLPMLFRGILRAEFCATPARAFDPILPLFGGKIELLVEVSRCALLERQRNSHFQRNSLGRQQQLERKRPNHFASVAALYERDHGSVVRFGEPTQIFGQFLMPLPQYPTVWTSDQGHLRRDMAARSQWTLEEHAERMAAVLCRESYQYVSLRLTLIFDRSEVGDTV
jgi:hypothetical protein